MAIMPLFGLVGLCLFDSDYMSTNASKCIVSNFYIIFSNVFNIFLILITSKNHRCPINDVKVTSLNCWPLARRFVYILSKTLQPYFLKYRVRYHFPLVMPARQTV